MSHKEQQYKERKRQENQMLKQTVLVPRIRMRVLMIKILRIMEIANIDDSEYTDYLKDIIKNTKGLKYVNFKSKMKIFDKT